MNTRRQAALVGTVLAASLTMVAPLTAEVLRIAVGVLAVFVLPGFAATYAVLGARRLSPTDRLLASLGISLAVTVCTAVLLAALPVGLTAASLSVTLGGGTAMLSVYALFRTRPGLAQTEPGPINEED
jgi:uncharacterized membrane protein